MKSKISTIFFLSILLFSCGKKNNASNEVAPLPYYTNPVGPVPNSQSLDTNVLRNIFSTASFDTGVAAGDYYDEVDVSGFSVNYSFNLFGKIFSSSAYTPVRYNVSNVDINYVDLSNGKTIDRNLVLDKVFSDNKTNYILKTRRGCAFTQESGVIPAVVIEKYLDNGNSGWWGQAGGQYLVERVVISTVLPLYLNPIMIETNYRTKYIRRFQSNSRVVNITKIGNCI